MPLVDVRGTLDQCAPVNRQRYLDSSYAPRDNLDGFPEYGVDLGQVISQPWYTAPLTMAGVTIALASFLLAGPLAEAGLAGAVAGFAVDFADLALTGGATALTFIEQRQQDVAAVSGSFDTWRLAERSDYLETGLGAAATLMCAMSMVFSGARLLKALRARKPGTLPQPPAARMLLARPSQRGALTGDGNRLLRRGTGTRARLAERQIQAGKPRFDTRPSMSAQKPRLAAIGTSGGPHVPGAPEPTPRASPAPARSVGDAPGASPAQAPAPAQAPTPPAPPGRSRVVDAAFRLSAYQRTQRGGQAQRYTERAVGAKLQKATGLPLLATESKAARALSVQGKSPQITQPILLEQPIITDPATAPPKLNWKGELVPPPGSAQPDYVYLAPDQTEIFEVTQDTRFRLVPQERGTEFRGVSELPRGDSHKAIQVNKATYLIRRYPELPLVYNIRAIGQVPDEVLTVLRTQAMGIQRFQKSIGATGEFQIILRADRIYVIP